MRSKRGGTLAVEEIVKLVIGIGVFIFILFILFALGKIVASNLKEQQARNTLDNIIYEIEKMTEGQIKEVLIESPKDWALMGRNKEICFCEISSELYPLKSEAASSISLDKSFEVCKRRNICRTVDLELLFSQTKCSPYGKWLSSNKYYQVLNCLSVSRVPLSVTLERNKDTVNIYSKESTYTGTEVSGWGAQNENCKIIDHMYSSSLINAGQNYVLPYILLNFSNCNLGILSASKVDFYLKCLDPYGSSEFHYPSEPGRNSCDTIEVSQENDFANFSSCVISKSLLSSSSSSQCELGVTISWMGTQSQEKVNGEWVERTTKSDFSNLNFIVNQEVKQCTVYSVSYLDKSPTIAYGFLFETDCDLNNFRGYLNSLPVTDSDGKDSWGVCLEILAGEDESKRYDQMDVLELKSSSNGHNFIKVNYPFLVDSPSFKCSQFRFYVSGKEFLVNVQSN